MESINRKVILIAVIMALLTSGIIYVFIKRATTKPEVVEYINIYVAAKTLPPKHKIADNDLKQTKVTREYLNSKAILNKADIVGKRIKDRIIEGEQILKDRLVYEDNTTLAYKIPEGKRAVSINVNEQVNVSNLLRPGDFVDVIASFDKEEEENDTNKTIYPRATRTIIQNIEVLAVGQEQLIEQEILKDLPKTITLAVTPNEVELLVYATEYGIVRLALRPVEDDKKINSEGIIRRDISSGKGVQTLPK